MAGNGSVEPAAEEDVDKLEVPGVNQDHTDAGSIQPAVSVIDLDNGNYPMNFNFYAAKKTMAQGLMDIALLTANASQLKALLQTNGDHTYYHFLLTLIAVSITFQIIVAIVFLVIGRMDISIEKNHRIMDILNNVAIGIVFIITVANIFISAFGISDLKVSNT